MPSTWRELEARAYSSKHLGRQGVGAGWSRGQTVALGLTIHSPLPAPQIAGRQEVGQGHRLGDRHDLPGRIIDQLGEADDEPLLGGQAEPLGGVAVGDILEEGFWIDGLAALPVDHGYDPSYPRVEIQGARVAAELAVHGALDGEGLEIHASDPVLLGLDSPDSGFRKAGSGPASSPSRVRRCHSMPAWIAVPMAAAFWRSRSAALTPVTASATAERTNSGSRAPGRARTSSIAASK